MERGSNTAEENSEISCQVYTTNSAKLYTLNMAIKKKTVQAMIN